MYVCMCVCLCVPYVKRTYATSVLVVMSIGDGCADMNIPRRMRVFRTPNVQHGLLDESEQKVQMLLELKRVPYIIETVPMACYGEKPASYLRMMPSGMIPSAELDGVLLKSSDEIMAAVEAKWTDVRTMPESSDTKLGRRARELLRLERELFGCWMQWITARGKGFAGGLEMVMVRTLWKERTDTAARRSPGIDFLALPRASESH